MGIYFQIHSFIQAHINYCYLLRGFTSKSTALSRHTLTTDLHYGDLLPNPQLYPGTHQRLLFIMGIDFQIHSFIQAHINYCSSLWGFTSKSTGLCRHTSTHIHKVGKPNRYLGGNLGRMRKFLASERKFLG